MTTAGAHTKMDTDHLEESYRGGPRPGTARALGLRAGIAAVVVVIVGALTYAVASAVPATYKSSSELRITVNGSTGLGQDSIQAANELTAQLVQLLPADSILAGPAAKLGMSTSALRSAISVGSVAQQNLIEISASGSSPGQAQARAATAASGFISFMAKDARTQQASYLRDLQGSIQGMNATVAKLETQLTSARGTRATVIETQLGSIASQQQTLRTELAQREASSAPVVEQLQTAGAGSKVAPRPVLYSLVALLVAAFVAAQLLTITERRRRAAF